ncbi:MAG TPA: hypothetical protein VK543_11210 [Puia sp.]|nr:hypothetical protein [Puia sp.]
MRKLAIIHFSPLELYPPVMNWLHFLERHGEQSLEIVVYTRTADREMEKFFPVSGRIKIKRLGSGVGGNAISRYLNYLRYYMFTFMSLLRWKPDTVLYYETLSALPAIWYGRSGNRKARIFAHYHEYITAAEYDEGMSINKRAHRLEKKTYPLYEWISHTNSDRMRLFREDNQNIRDDQVHILPNYPPVSWQHLNDQQVKNDLARFVYVGALSLDNMFTAEFAQWIIGQQGKAEWDIYSNNITADARQYIESLHSAYIHFWGGVDYFRLPHQLKDYDIGIILYKGTILNYVYNAPNKLFEYLACGLDVWFPEIMESCRPFITRNAYPQVKSVDFNALHDVNLASMQKRAGMRFKPSVYYCERVFPALYKKITLDSRME